jgi:adenosylcobinamide-phosphate guanylyltransferase
MIASIMCGGKGSRMKHMCYTEKPLLLIKGVPMVEYVLNAVVGSRKFSAVFAVTSLYTPTTALYLKSHKYYLSGIVDATNTSGVDYSTDLGQLIEMLKPSTLFVAPSDMPLLNIGTINEILKYWKPAIPYFSVIIKKDFVERFGIKPSIVIRDRGLEYCHSGISIIDTSKVTVGSRTEETYIKLNRKEIAFNINTEVDLAAINTEIN